MEHENNQEQYMDSDDFYYNNALENGDKNKNGKLSF